MKKKDQKKFNKLVFNAIKAQYKAHKKEIISKIKDVTKEDIYIKDFCKMFIPFILFGQYDEGFTPKEIINEIENMANIIAKVISTNYEFGFEKELRIIFRQKIFDCIMSNIAYFITTRLISLDNNHTAMIEKIAYLNKWANNDFKE